MLLLLLLLLFVVVLVRWQAHVFIALQVESVERRKRVKWKLKTESASFSLSCFFVYPTPSLAASQLLRLSSSFPHFLPLLTLSLLYLSLSLCHLYLPLAALWRNRAASLLSSSPAPQPSRAKIIGLERAQRAWPTCCTLIRQVTCSALDPALIHCPLSTLPSPCYLSLSRNLFFLSGSATGAARLCLPISILRIRIWGAYIQLCLCVWNEHRRTSSFNWYYRIPA